jgi:hypothetical protein
MSVNEYYCEFTVLVSQVFSELLQHATMSSACTWLQKSVIQSETKKQGLKSEDSSVVSCTRRLNRKRHLTCDTPPSTCPSLLSCMDELELGFEILLTSRLQDFWELQEASLPLEKSAYIIRKQGYKEPISQDSHSLVLCGFGSRVKLGTLQGYTDEPTDALVWKQDTC